MECGVALALSPVCFGTLDDMNLSRTHAACVQMLKRFGGEGGLHLQGQYDPSLQEQRGNLKNLAGGGVSSCMTGCNVEPL